MGHTMTLNSGDTVSFNMKKNFECIRSLGAGGTGQVYLFKESATGLFFAVKKYHSADPNKNEDYYRRFVDEVKILFNLSHPNIVRVYNHYLYPEQKLGYLQMEYVIGTSIDNYINAFLDENILNKLFSEAISAFDYLEKNGILHRDVRPSNILVNNNDSIKIIDFGFGKQCSVASKEPNSIFLNWPVSEMPDDIRLNQSYDHKTEIFFVGKLFHIVIKNNGLYDTFAYSHILDKMIESNPDQRYHSFSEILGDIAYGTFNGFDDADKDVYRVFVDSLFNKIGHYVDKCPSVNALTSIITLLSQLLRSISLEKYVQDNAQLIKCFISGGFGYMEKKSIEVSIVENFYRLILSASPAKQKIIYDNLRNRFAAVKIKDDDDIPF